MKKHWKIIVFVLVGIAALLIFQVLRGNQKLFEISVSGGYGTEEMTAGTNITVYTNATMSVSSGNAWTPGFIRTRLSRDDYKRLEKLTEPEAIAAMDVGESEDVFDGCSRYICVYGQWNKLLVEQGGYEPSGKEFNSRYSEIMLILNQYQ